MCAQSVFGKESDSLDTARQNLQQGRYEEALEAYDAIDSKDADPIAIALGRSRAFFSMGRWKDATETITAALKDHADSPQLWARLAELQFQQGGYADAEKNATEALRRDGENLLARLVRADAFTETGRLDQALNEYRWFVRYYNSKQPKDAESLILVGRGSLQYARWKSVSPIFNFVINTLCPDALKADAKHWQAYYMSGALLLEKYNRAQALPEFQQALAINPRAAEVLASQADAAYQKREFQEADEFANRALEIDPRFVPALRIKADIRLNGGQADEALKLVEQALEVNPYDQRTLARQAACFLLKDGTPSQERLSRVLAAFGDDKSVELEKPTRFEKLALELSKRNPRPGYFLTHLGETLEGQRKFALAENLYRSAIDVMPQLADPQTALGMLYMRIGKTAEAREILDSAFKADRYHVRVSNMRKVLTLLEDYGTIETEHFVVHFDTEADKLLARYMAEYLEEIYDELVNHYGFEPPERTHFEIYHDAKGQSAHQWFSARMVGLPWIQTIGASTGMIVALASPTASERPYNWAKVLRHEFVHIITLQQTHFNIPHWFTEALAVTAEGYARPAIWNRLLLERVPKGELRNLDNLTDGFVRAKNAEDWQFAYCQSRLYAQYMLEEFGPETIAKMLDAYRLNLSTADAIQRAFGIDQATFEKGYRQFLDRIVADLTRSGEGPERTLAELEQAHRDDPENAEAAAAYAYGLFEARQLKQARELALKAHEKNSSEPLAAVVLASLEIRDDNVPAAFEYLNSALDRDDPHPRVLLLLAKIQMLEQQYAEAAKSYNLGHERFPDDPAWVRGMSAAYLKAKDTEQVLAALEQLAHMDADDAVARKKLAELALDRGDHAGCVKYAKMALHVDVEDAETHALLARAYRGQKQHQQAADEYLVALELKPDETDWQLALAETYRELDRNGEAKTLLEGILDRDPDHAEARKLLDSLK